MTYGAPDWQMNAIDWNEPFDFGSFVNFPPEDDAIDAPFG